MFQFSPSHARAMLHLPPAHRTNSSASRGRRRRATRNFSLRLEPFEQRLLLSIATINWAAQQQTIAGFGASSAWMSGTFTSSQQQLLWSTTNGAGLSLLRSHISPDTNSTSTEISIMQEATAMGVTIFSTPWTPPAAWKSNNNIDTIVNGTDTGGFLLASHYQDYANWLKQYVINMAGNGIPIYAVSMQNEPNWSADYESSRWTSAMFYDVLPILENTLASDSRTANVKIILPEEIHWNNLDLVSQVLGSTESSYTNLIYADHTYGINTVSNSTYPGKDGYTPMTNLYNLSGNPIWETEHSGDAASLGITAALNEAQSIYDIVYIAQAGAYNHWWIKNATAGDGAGLLDTNWQVDPVYNGMAQFSKFVRPGWVAIGESDDNNGLRISAFKSTSSGDFAIVAINQGSSPITETFNLNGAHSPVITPWGTSATLSLAQQQSLPATGNGGAFSYTIPAKSIFTFTGNASASPVTQAPVGLLASSTASTAITLNWTANLASATGYTVERSTNGTSWTTVTSALSSGTFTYTDAGRTANTLYYYRVQANNSNVSSNVVAKMTQPLAPTNLTGSYNTTTQNVLLSWTGNGSSTTATAIDRSTDGGVTWTTLRADLSYTTTTYTDTTAPALATVTYRVRSVYGLNSAATNLVTVTAASPSVDPVVWYKIDESSGGTLNDASGNGKNATLAVAGAPGAYSFVPGHSGNAVAFTGSGTNGGYASLPSGIVNNVGDFTIATWIKLTTLDTSARIFDFGTSTSNYMFLTSKSSGTSLPRFGINAGGTGEQQIASTVALSTGVWQHVVVEVAGGSGSMYINGNLVGAAAGITYNAASLGITTNNFIGDSQFAANPFLNGAVDDFRIYDRGLSLSEIQLLAGNGPSVATPASASPATASGTTATLSVLGADNGGEPNLIYTWAATGSPPAAVTFSSNATNSSKNTVVTFHKAGTYNFTVTITDTQGLAITSGVAIIVNQTLTGASASIAPATITIAPGGSAQLALYGNDQFGSPIALPLNNVTWSIYSGAGVINASGLYTASAEGTTTVRAISPAGATFYATVNVLYQVAWYPADATTGTVLTDATGHGWNGTLSGSAAFGPGISGNAVKLTGGAVTLPGNIVSTLNDFTVSAWVNLDSLSTWSRIFDFGSGTRMNMYLTPQANNSTGPLRFAITINNYQNEQQIVGTSSLATGSWQHVAVTLAGNTGTLYLNGIAVSSNSSMTLHPISVGTTSQDYLGDSQYAQDPALLGSLDDFRIIGRALSASEILSLAKPSIVTAATYSSLTPTSANLSVVASDITAGEASLAYTWAATGTPPAPVIFSANATHAARSVTATFTKPGTYNFVVTATNNAGQTASSTISLTVVTTVAGRFLFYGGSAFDISHDNAIATDKSALLAGQTAAFANYSSFDRGINGIMIDVSGPVGPLTTSDFIFQIGNTSDTTSWTIAPSPISVTQRPGAGTGASTRFDIVWADNTIQNTWLQMTLKGRPGAASGLPNDDTFYFGSAIGESGNDPTSTRVDATDQLIPRANATSSASITDPCDYNRDGMVDAADEQVARTHATSFLNDLQLIIPLLPPSGAAQLAIGTLAPGGDLPDSQAIFVRSPMMLSPESTLSAILQPIATITPSIFDATLIHGPWMPAPLLNLQPEIHALIAKSLHLPPPALMRLHEPALARHARTFLLKKRIATFTESGYNQPSDSGNPGLSGSMSRQI